MRDPGAAGSARSGNEADRDAEALCDQLEGTGVPLTQSRSSKQGTSGVILFLIQRQVVGDPMHQFVVHVEKLLPHRAGRSGRDDLHLCQKAGLLGAERAVGPGSVCCPEARLQCEWMKCGSVPR